MIVLSSLTNRNLLQEQAAQYLAATLEKETFKVLLNRIAQRYPSRSALAQALRITPSRLSRALNTGDFPLNVSNCLRLAKLSGESATEILRAAGKGDVAELIEGLYGKDRTRLLTMPERELLDEWHALSPRAREALGSIISDLSPKKPAKHKRTA